MRRRVWPEPRWPLRRCRHIYRWKTGYPDNRCANATITGVCVEHRLERYRWEHSGRRLYVTLDLSNINRPYLSIDESRPRTYVSLSWGNRNSDPVFMVELKLRRP